MARLTDEQWISITLPVRGATGSHPHALGDAEFQSTLPVRGATLQTCNLDVL